MSKEWGPPLIFLPWVGGGTTIGSANLQWKNPRGTPTIFQAASSIDKTWNDPSNQKAVKDLMGFVSALRAIPAVKKLNEPINIVAHSQGSLITLAALAHGMTADNLVVLNSPIGIGQHDTNSDLNVALRNLSGSADFYWSPDDAATRLINGSAQPVRGPNQPILYNGAKFDQHEIQGGHGESDKDYLIPFYNAHIRSSRKNNLGVDAQVGREITNLLLMQFPEISQFLPSGTLRIP